MDSTPTGDDLLDPIPADIVNGGDHDVHYWLTLAAVRAWQIHDKALARLVSRRILDQRGGAFHWVLRFDWGAPKWRQPRVYPVIDGESKKEVKARILAELFDGDIPDPRDVMIINLADACGLFPSCSHRSS